MLLELHPDALEELDAAVARHDRERPGYGRKRISQAARLPKSGAPVVGFDAEYDVRSYGVRRFRYRVITAIVKGSPLVVAVAHTSRDPGYWRDRLE